MALDYRTIFDHSKFQRGAGFLPELAVIKSIYNDYILLAVWDQRANATTS